MGQHRLDRKSITRGVWGTRWTVEKELRDSPGFAFIRRYLSHFDFSTLEWVTLSRGRQLRYFSRLDNPIYGRCSLPEHRASGLWRINCNVDVRVRYPVDFRVRYPAASPEISPFVLYSESEAIVAIVAHEASHYLGATGQVPANGRVHPSGMRSTSEAEAGEFMWAAVEEYRRTVADGSSGPPVRARWCVMCGKKLPTGGGPRTFCSPACRSEYHNRLRSARIAARRGERVCEVCGATFAPPRKDAKTCSPACRQKKYRQRRALQQTS
jgi:predicted nucleic acid-binding Zn ribbon protein